jgi:hypothetical protein
MRPISAIACALAAMAAAALTSLAPPAEARTRLPPGSWQASCQNAYIDGDYLYAQCLDNRNRWRNAFIDLSECDGSISNQNGQLVCDYVDESYGGQTHLPRGNWVDVCWAANVQDGRMEASCSDGSRYVDSALEIDQCNNNVTVNKGRLRCESGSGRWGNSMGLLPRGNWVDVCWIARVDNGTMQAQCDDGRGNNISSALSLRTCRSNNVTVNRGKLRCG